MWILVSSLLIALSWGAPTKVRIDSKLLVGGEKVASPRIFANEGRKSKIVMNDGGKEYSLEVLPQDIDQKKVNLKYSLSIRDRNLETLTRGSIRIPQNKSGLISLDKGRIKVFLKIKES